MAIYVTGKTYRDGSMDRPKRFTSQYEAAKYQQKHGGDMVVTHGAQRATLSSGTIADISSHAPQQRKKKKEESMFSMPMFRF